MNGLPPPPITSKMTALLIRLWHRYGSTFAGDVAVVAGGTAMAQIIGIIFLPFITRRYGPEAFGILNVFLCIVAMVASIATLSYSHSIVLPKRDLIAYQLLKLSILLACVVSLIVTLLITILKAPIVAMFNIEIIAPFLWMIPLAAFITAAIQSFEQWQIRCKRFKSLSVAVVAQSGFAGGSRILIGLMMPTATILIILGMVAQVFQICILYLFTSHNMRHMLKFRDRTIHSQLLALRAVARRYSDFPLYRAPQLLLNTISRAVPMLLLASLFSPAVVGLFAIAQRVLYLPVNLIAQSVGKVFLQRITSQAHSNNPLQPMILRATIVLALLGIVPFGAIILAGPWLFGLVFGADWLEAGSYARWLGILIYFNFINVPAIQSFAVTNSQGILLAWEVVTTVIKIILFVSIGTMTQNAELTVAVYAVFGGVAYIVLILIGLSRAGKYEPIR